jgi:cyclophilin family peptidyl-prolyl cis-trans isomerase
MTQAIHHADDHRTHILSILGARVLEVPELDLWAYAESVGQMVVDESRKFRANVHTPRGEFVIALAGAGVAPSTVTRFVYIAQNNFYDGLTFHRVVPGLVVQGGDPSGSGTSGPSHTQPSEDSTSTWPRGTAGIVSSPAGVIGSEFFVTLADAAFPEAGGAYSHLGQVSAGMEVVDQIQAGEAIISLEISLL